MDLLKLFETTSQYNSFAESQDMTRPNVSFCIDEHDTHYNPKTVKVFLKYNIEDISVPCNIVNDYTNIRKTVIDEGTENEDVWVLDDGIESAPRDYTFTTTGEHTVTVTLTNPTVLTAGMFWSCPLTEARINYGVKTIGDNVFRECHNMETVNIPEGVTEIGQYAFMNCFKLKVLNISSTVKTLKSSAFNGCGNITKMNIGKSLSTIEDYVFWDLHNIKYITVDEENKKYHSESNAIIDTANNTLVCGSNITIIPQDITNIGKGAFAGRQGLTSITIPENVTVIGESAFATCINLRTVEVLSEGTQDEAGVAFGQRVFDSCNKLAKTLDGNVGKLIIHSIKPPVFPINVLTNIDFTNNFRIEVPSGSEQDYKDETSGKWPDLTNYIYAIGSV